MVAASNPILMDFIHIYISWVYQFGKETVTHVYIPRTTCDSYLRPRLQGLAIGRWIFQGCQVLKSNAGEILRAQLVNNRT